MMRAAVAFGVLASARKDGRGCRCDDLAGPRTAPRVYDVPVGFRTHNLSSQVVLMKVPETGSSTVSNLLVELAAKRQRPLFIQHPQASSRGLKVVGECMTRNLLLRTISN